MSWKHWISKPNLICGLSCLSSSTKTWMGGAESRDTLRKWLHGESGTENRGHIEGCRSVRANTHGTNKRYLSNIKIANDGRSQHWAQLLCIDPFSSTPTLEISLSQTGDHRCFVVTERAASYKKSNNKKVCTYVIHIWFQEEWKKKSYRSLLWDNTTKLLITWYQKDE